MDLLLAGTGPATGFPIPGCPCAACSVSSSVFGPASSAVSAGLPPRRPAELRLRVEDAPGWRLGIAEVLRESDGFVVRPQAGDRLELPGVAIRVLGAGDGPAGLVLLIHPGRGEPVLWAPQGGPLNPVIVDGLAGIELAFAILGPVPERDAADPQADQPPLVDCALALARLRRAGSATSRTRCLLVGSGHRQGDQGRLALCLAHWGAEAPVDGARFDHNALDARVGFGLGGRTLVLGGGASGKSGLAEQLLAAEPEVLYTATGPIVDLRSQPDAEWAERVSRHRERRPAWWRTEETHEVATLLAKAEQPVLLDSIGTWLTGVLDRCGAWSDHEGWRRRLAAETDALVRSWRARRAPLVAVTDEVGWGVVPATTAGRLFRDELGRLNRRLADESEQVLVVVAGRVLNTGVHTTKPEPQ